MAELLRCTDRWGREVILSDGQWSGHIQPGHAEMTNQLAAVRRAIEAPDRVNHDQRNPNGENFYVLGGLPPPLDRTWVKVCVRFTLLAPNGPWRGEIVTAYATSIVKQAEVQKWP